MNLQDIGRLLQQRNKNVQGGVPGQEAPGGLDTLSVSQDPMSQDPTGMEQPPEDACGPMPQFGRPYYLLAQGEKDAIIAWKTCKAGA